MLKDVNSELFIDEDGCFYSEEIIPSPPSLISGNPVGSAVIDFELAQKLLKEACEKRDCLTCPMRGVTRMCVNRERFHTEV